MDINQLIGEKIRSFRKSRNLTLEDFSQRLFKSRATISKYERGEIAVDVATLYEIAEILDVDINQLLVYKAKPSLTKHVERQPAFFKDVLHFYSYLYDGRANKIMRTAFDVIPSDKANQNNVFMYMNFEDYNHYQDCENTYSGVMEHFDAVTNIHLKNNNTQIARGNITILASFTDSKTKWGLFNSLSIRPMMPISVKMLFSKEIIKDESYLEQLLKVSDEDIRNLKQYNMFSVT